MHVVHELQPGNVHLAHELQHDNVHAVHLQHDNVHAVHELLADLFRRYISMAGTQHATFARQTPQHMRDEWLYYAKHLLGFKPSADATTDAAVNEELVRFLK